MRSFTGLIQRLSMSLFDPLPGLQCALTAVFDAVLSGGRIGLDDDDDALHPLDLARAFSDFAPKVLSMSELESVRNPSVLRLRFVLVKLARGLMTFFAEERSDRVAVIGSPALSAESGAFLREMGSDAAAGREIILQDEALAVFGGIVLSAALHSTMRDSYVAAILQLPNFRQDTLAQAVSMILLNDDPEDEGNLAPTETTSSIDLTRHAEDEDNSDDSHTSSMVGDFRKISLSTLDSNVLKENKSIGNKTNAVEVGKANWGRVEHSLETSAVKAESAELRERVLALEQELREKSAQVAAITAHAAATKQNTALGATATGEDDTDATAGEIFSLSDLELMRAKAASADALQASLSKASARLEQAGDVRKRVDDLERENAEFRDNEDRLHNRISILESQLEASNARAESLVQLTEGLAGDLQEREFELSAKTEEVEQLNYRLNAANIQIASLLGSASSRTDAISSAHDSGEDEASTSRNVPSIDRNPRTENDKDDKTLPHPVDCSKSGVGASYHESSCNQNNPGNASSHDCLEIASADLRNKLGVIMPWDDVIDCVRGVVDAMREMDEAEAAGQHYAAQKSPPLSSSHGDHQLGAPGMENRISSSENLEAPSAPRHESSMHLSTADCGDTVPVHGDEHQVEAMIKPFSSESCRHSCSNRILQDFIEVDMRMEASCKAGDDDFDFVADETNVAEVRFPQDCASPSRDGFAASSAPVILRQQSEDSASDAPERVTARYANRGHAATPESDGNRSVDSSYAKGFMSAVYASKPSSANNAPYDCRITTPAFDNLPFESSASARKSVDHLGSRTSASRSFASIRKSLRSGEQKESASTTHCSTLHRSYSARVSSIRLLIHQLGEARNLLDRANGNLYEKDRECAELRHELGLLIKEVDGLMAQKAVLDMHENYMLKEKERLIAHLTESLQARTSELGCAREEIERSKDELAVLDTENSSLSEEIASLNQKLAESFNLQEETLRAQELDIARLGAQLEASELLARKVSECVSETESLKIMANEARRGFYQEVMDTIQLEKEIVEATRQENRQYAQFQSDKLEEIHASAQTAAAGREYEVRMQLSKSRRSTRVGAFLRRLMPHEPAVYNTSMVLRPFDETRPDHN